MIAKMFNWVNDRLPIVNTFERHLSKHPVPKKVNFWYLFGALATIVLIIQILSGIWLMMPYSNTEDGAFASIEYIMRDVDYGWVIRYMHTTGASCFLQLFIFICSELTLWFLSKTQRISLVIWMHNLLGDDGRRVFRICLTLWPDVLLGCTGNYFSFWSNTLYR